MAQDRRSMLSCRVARRTPSLCSLVLGLALAPAAAFGAQIANGNGGFELNDFSELPGFPDLDGSSSPGSIDSWEYIRSVSPLAALARVGPYYTTAEGSYMLGLGSIPDAFPNQALTARAETSITGLVVDQHYVLRFWLAPGHLAAGEAGDPIYGSETDAVEAAGVVVSVATPGGVVASSVFSAIPSVKATPTPATLDWQLLSLGFDALATELSLSFETVPGPNDTTDALRGFYFVDGVTIAVPEPTSAASGLAAWMTLAALGMQGKKRRGGSRSRQYRSGTKFCPTRVSWSS